MAKKQTFFLTGDKALDKTLRGLEPKIAKKVVSKATRSGMKIMQKAVKDESPVGETGMLKKSVKVRSAKRSRRSFGMLVQFGEGNFKGKSWYAAAVEYGTSKMEPRGFMRKAFDANEEKVRTHTMNEIVAGIEREAK